MTCDPKNEAKMTINSLLLETGEMDYDKKNMVKFGFGDLLP